MIELGIYIGTLLLIGSIYDWKYCNLPVWILVAGGVGGVAGILYTLLCEKRSPVEVGLALLPGIGAVLLAYVTHEQIGYGDGVFLLCIGGCLGKERTMMIVMAALSGICVVSILLLICKKVGKNSRIPFVPFLALGCVLVLLGGLQIE